MKVDNRPMHEIIKEEIDRCDKLVKKRLENGSISSKMVATIMIWDIKAGERAIEEKDENAMFHALRALRQNN